MRVDPNLINRIVREWDGERTQSIISAIGAELEQEIRHTRNPQEKDFLMNLRGQIEDQNFWENMDCMLHYEFRY